MSYIGNQPVLQTTQFRDEFPVTASTQKSFATSGFHPNAVSVYRNGVLLTENGDYSKGSDNVTITLTNAAVAGDIVVIEGHRDLTQGLTTTESRYEVVIANNAITVTTPFPLLNGYTDVFINGVKQAQGVNNVTADYSINSSTNVVSFTQNPVNGDLITVVSKHQASALVALPLKDSSGAEILSESGSTVTLANVDTATIGSNALVVDSSGNVGIGTSSSPSQKLQVDGGAARITGNYSSIANNQGLLLGFTGDNASYYAVGANGGGVGQHIFYSYNYSTSAGSERMRIDGSGNLKINEGATVVGSISGFTGGELILGDTTANTQNSISTVATGTPEMFFDHRGTSSGAWIFRSSASNRMTIDSSGNVLVGYTSSNGSYKLQVNSQIFATSSTIATSDGHYKENIQPLDSGLAIVKALNPVQFDWKAHPVHQFDREHPTVGFIAQEVQEVLADKTYKNSIIKSNTIVITPEELDEDGNVITAEVTEEFLGIAEGNLVAILTKAIQEQQTIIESQQSQIDTLTARIEALEATL